MHHPVTSRPEARRATCHSEYGVCAFYTARNGSELRRRAATVPKAAFVSYGRARALGSATRVAPADFRALLAVNGTSGIIVIAGILAQSAARGTKFLALVADVGLCQCSEIHIRPTTGLAHALHSSKAVMLHQTLGKEARHAAGMQWQRRAMKPVAKILYIYYSVSWVPPTRI